MTPTLSIELPEKLQSLLEESAFRAYTNGVPNPETQTQLETVQLAEIFPGEIGEKRLAKCCLSGLWLLHNFLDESHTISQDIKTAEGSFWHAIMHRLEGDFSNAKYWYHRVGQHPVFSDIADTIGVPWNSDDFVDRCQAELRRGKLTEETHAIAVTEWIALFEYCYRWAK